jgi:dolichol-phosphate mannosyltransferase
VKLSLVIPARNEAKNIGPTLTGLAARLARERIDYEIIVVDDGSSDATVTRVRDAAAGDARIRLVENTGLHGFGRAVRKGLEAFSGDAVVICMADGSDAPDDVVRCYSVLRDEAECAFGSRFVAGARVEGYPKLKLVINRLANLLIRLLFGLRYNDVTNAFKGYRANVIRGCQPLLSPHFNLTVELPLKAIVRGYTYAVFPIQWRNRRYGVSSLHLQEMGSRYLYVVLNVWLEKLLTRDDFRRHDSPARASEPPARPQERAPAAGPAGPHPDGGPGGQGATAGRAA